MKDFLLDVEPIATAPATAFQHLPTQLMIRVEGLTDDMQNCRLYCETVSQAPFQAPYTSRLNVSQDRLIMPLSMISSAVDANGNIVPAVMSQILAQFQLQLKTTETNSSTTQS